MTSRDEAMQALGSPDWTGGQVEDAPRGASMVFSVRVPGELADWIASEADRRQVSPSVVIRDAVAASRRAGSAEETVTVRLSDLHRAIDQAAHHAA